MRALGEATADGCVEAVRSDAAPPVRSIGSATTLVSRLTASVVCSVVAVTGSVASCLASAAADNGAGVLVLVGLAAAQSDPFDFGSLLGEPSSAGVPGDVSVSLGCSDLVVGAESSCLRPPVPTTTPGGAERTARSFVTGRQCRWWPCSWRSSHRTSRPHRRRRWAWPSPRPGRRCCWRQAIRQSRGSRRPTRARCSTRSRWQHRLPKRQLSRQPDPCVPRWACGMYIGQVQPACRECEEVRSSATSTSIPTGRQQRLHADPGPGRDSSADQFDMLANMPGS